MCTSDFNSSYRYTDDSGKKYAIVGTCDDIGQYTNLTTDSYKYKYSSSSTDYECSTSCSYYLYIYLRE